MDIRKIIHIDMDAFFASIEQRDFPQYRSKPVAVGGARERGVVAAASYEARKFGIHSAMPTVTARRLCPALIIIPPRFDVYVKVSDEIMEILRSYTHLVEPMSLDEAFLDVTGNRKGISSATLIARDIKEEIKRKTSLTASAGVSINKFLAKMASDMDKPDGLFVIRPEEAQAFIDNLKIEKFYGVGKATSDKMHANGIFTGNDLKQRSRPELVRLFGKHGRFFYDIARAVDERPVNPVSIRKSYGREQTFDSDVSDPGELNHKMEDIAMQLWEGLEEHQLRGRTLVVKIKYSDFVQITRSRTIGVPLDDPETIMAMAREIITREYPFRNPVRLLGISVTNLTGREPVNEDDQLELDFNNPQ
jgi:DNA polymerase-4